MLPDFVVTEMVAPGARPYSAVNGVVTTLNSPIASIDGRDLPPVPGEVLDTTGAGDALAAGYLVGGAELAMEAAARCIANLGTMP